MSEMPDTHEMRQMRRNGTAFGLLASALMIGGIALLQWVFT